MCVCDACAACVRACVRACVHPCVCVCARSRLYSDEITVITQYMSGFIIDFYVLMYEEI